MAAPSHLSTSLKQGASWSSPQGVCKPHCDRVMGYPALTFTFTQHVQGCQCLDSSIQNSVTKSKPDKSYEMSGSSSASSSAAEETNRKGEEDETPQKGHSWTIMASIQPFQLLAAVWLLLSFLCSCWAGDNPPWACRAHQLYFKGGQHGVCAIIEGFLDFSVLEAARGGPLQDHGPQRAGC